MFGEKGSFHFMVLIYEKNYKNLFKIHCHTAPLVLCHGQTNFAQASCFAIHKEHLILSEVTLPT